MALERLDKILSSTGRWSRKEIKDMVRHGRVRADGMTVAKPEDKFDPAAAHRWTARGWTAPPSSMC